MMLHYGNMIKLELKRYKTQGRTVDNLPGVKFPDNLNVTSESENLLKGIKYVNFFCTITSIKRSN